MEKKVYRGLEDLELDRARGFIRGLPEASRIDVPKIIEVANGVADEFANSVSVFGTSYTSAIRSSKGKRTRGGPVLNVYGIGGYSRKEGDRKNVDLMVATNLWWPGAHGSYFGFKPLFEANEGDELFMRLMDEVENTFNGDMTRTIPPKYDLGLHKTEALYQFSPKEVERKPIDIKLVMSRDTGFSEDEKRTVRFINEAEFDHLDVEKAGGKPLPKVLLSRNCEWSIQKAVV